MRSHGSGHRRRPGRGRRRVRRRAWPAPRSTGSRRKGSWGALRGNSGNLNRRARRKRRGKPEPETMGFPAISAVNAGWPDGVHGRRKGVISTCAKTGWNGSRKQKTAVFFGGVAGGGRRIRPGRKPSDQEAAGKTRRHRSCRRPGRCRGPRNGLRNRAPGRPSRSASHTCRTVSRFSRRERGS